MNLAERKLINRYKIIFLSYSLLFLSSCNLKYVAEEMKSGGNSQKPFLTIKKDTLPSSVSLNEGSSLSITVELSAATNQGLIFTLNLQGSQGEISTTHFDLTQNSFVIPAGQTTAQFSIVTINDTIYHSTSQWTLRVFSTSSSIDSSDTLNFSLNDNDPDPTSVPSATLSGLPSDPSNSLFLNASIGGNNVVNYQYKIGPSATTFCNLSADYSVDFSISSNLMENLSSYPEGPLTLCVVGKDSNGSQQLYSNATTYTWTKDTVAPTALLTGEPTGTSGTKNLVISVSGSGVVSYQYKVGATGSTNCGLAAGYSTDTLISQNITNDISAISDGNITLCVLGKDNAGNLQSTASATSTSWIKDTVAPTVISVNSAKANGAYSTGVNIDIAITFSKIVNVTSGSPTLDLNSHMNAKATYLSGTGSTILIFRYTVGLSDSTSDLEYSQITSLGLSGANIQDNFGNSADLTLPAIGGGSSLGSLKNIMIDTTRPTPPSTLIDGTWSNSTSETPTLIYTIGTDLESGIASHQLKIIDSTNGNTDVTNFSAHIPWNSVTGLSLTSGVTYKMVVRSIDNAGNYSSEVVSDGWTVDTNAPTNPGAITIGTVPTLFKQQTPPFTFSESIDSLSGIAFYQMEVRKSSDNSIIKSYVTASGNGSGLSYNEGSNFLTSGESYYANIRAVDNAGNTSGVTQSGSWIAFQCPTHFIQVPARSPYTNSTFCVAKYEMKLQYDGVIIASGNTSNTYNYDTNYETPTERAKYVAVSNPSGRPWVYIKRGENGNSSGQGAIEACRNLGAEYDLISNAEWQSIAQNTEWVAANWTSGVVGTQMMYRGHVDGNPNTSLEVINTSDSYDQTGNNSGQTWGSGKEQSRTLTLSNGEVIWDLAGNVWEWVKDNNTTTFEANNWITALLSSNGTTGTVGGLTGNAKYLFGPSGTYALGASQYGGLGYGWVNSNSGAVIRGGGTLGSPTYQGLFYTDLSGDPWLTDSLIGFRCTFH